MSGRIGMTAGNGRAHPLVCQLFELMRQRRVHVEQFTRRVGIHRSTLKQWRDRSSPTLAVFVATAAALGYDVVLRAKREDV